MINQHPGDAEIQQYVLQQEECDEVISQHIRGCAACSMKATQYGLLFKEIAEQDKPAFDFNLASLVTRQLPETRPESSRKGVFFYLLIAVPVIPGAVVFYFFENNLWGMFQSITPVLAGLVITTAVCLSAFLCFDMYRKYQAKMNALGLY